MRNFTSLIVLTAASFFMSPFESSAKETSVKNKKTEFENVFAFSKYVSKVTVDAESINQFYKKYPKLKKYQNDVLDLYKKKEYHLIWYDDKSVSEFGALLYHKVQLLNDQGIKATMPYMDLVDDVFNENVTADLPQIDTELLLSNMYVFYASNVYSGVDPATLKKIGWFLPAKTISYVKILDSLMVDPDRLNKDENLLYGQYYKLKSMLKKYRTIEKNNLWTNIDIDAANYKDLKPFDSGVAVKQIRQRLFVIGDLAQDSKSQVYDEEMMAGVLKYKKRYGLKLNYALTKEHIDQMNEPIGNRIKTIMLNMERCRWIPTQLAQASEYVMVNIPSFKLVYVKNGKYELVSDVFVGTRMTETVIFSGNMDRIVFSPYWYVPQSIIKNELKLKMAEDKNYLADHDMEWNGGNVRQKPGPKNSLGLVKFMFPNPNDIYLHDTPAKSLFEFEKRIFSHGCINVKEAKGLALAILKDDPDWPVDKIDQAMSGEKETTCKLKTKIPIYIGYFTAWVSDDGEIGFYPDVYDRDPQLDKLLYSDSVAAK
ncbi:MULTISPECIES: murein L,D-transpeptidase [unclassified Flavobacterium]|uniref:L,D-transpeptidase family protein n=1 Tax=unclassified Flavobacterium TaxID=196869 RepID=UPI0012A88337|nr:MULTISPECIES: L,D-transpeptidase family protein [unclassified Flavobacterium]MBF4483943.1 L,D-transpeptidase family protein [Flavobacterium sp. CSZ]QGK75945.1 L,D-transpeptidase family protein [Flavobacterium sp. SLB02]